MTRLEKPVSRVTKKCIKGKPIVVTVAPLGAQEEARIGFRLHGERTQYVCLLSDVFRCAALWHGQKEAKAKREARRQGIPWRIARKKFIAENSI